MQDQDQQALQDQLALRAQAQDPTLNSPWKQAARSGIDFGMGALGLGDQGQPGPTASNAGAMLAAGVGTIPETLIKSLMALPRTSAPEATSKLLELLNGFKGLSGADAKAEALASLPGNGSTGYYLPKPTKFTEMYQSLKDRVPEVADSLELGHPNPSATRLIRPPGFPKIYNQQQEFFIEPKKSSETRLQDLLSSRAPMGSGTDPESLELAAKSGLQQSMRTTPISSGSIRGGATGSGRQSALARAGLSEDSVRNLRKMTIDEAKKLYPNMSPNTLGGIIRGDTYSWIK